MILAKIAQYRENLFNISLRNSKIIYKPDEEEWPIFTYELLNFSKQYQ